jgi:Protein of unknown function (DUF1549)/Protein of unknown function (DUF1553)/WD domain, G-beta repeat
MSRLPVILSFSTLLLLGISACGADPPVPVPPPIVGGTTGNGSLSVSFTGKRISLRKAATGEKLHWFEGLASPARVAVVAPDGSLLASGGQDRMVYLWRPDTGKLVYRLAGHASPINALAFSPDSRFLASAGDDGIIRLWNVTAGKELFQLRGHRSSVSSLAFSPDGRMLASAHQEVRLWELASAREVLRLPGSDRMNCQVAFRSDGRGLLVVDRDRCTVLGVNLASGKPEGRWALERLEATLSDSLLEKGKQTALKVRAHWAGGSTQDVTRWVVAAPIDPAVAWIPAPGKVEPRGPGRTAVVVRYAGRETAVAVSVPFPATGTFPRLSPANFIDNLLIADWKRISLRPAGPAPDARFLRRAYLQVTGGLPPPEEVRRFLGSKDPDKRHKLIDRLLDQPGHAEHWASLWADFLAVGGKRVRDEDRAAFEKWLRQALRKNQPADEIVRELLLAGGKRGDAGPEAFYLAHRTPVEMAEATARGFLGIDLRCAYCHRQPGGAWGPEDYLGLAAFFGGVEVQDGQMPVLRLDPKRPFPHPLTGKPVAPRLPGPLKVEIKRNKDPRERLARWIAHRDNLSFARNIVNRYWAELFGRGLVEPVGDLRPANLPCQPELFDALTRDFIKHRYDLKHLVRILCQSQAFGLDLQPATPEGFFNGRVTRRLSSKVLLRLIAQATGVKPEVLPSSGEFWIDRKMTGRPRCPGQSCERHLGVAPSPGLLLPNSDRTARAIVHPKGRVARLLASQAKDEKIIEELFLATVSRFPEQREARACLEHVRKKKGADARKEGFQDIVWALINTAEFCFLH